MADFRERENPFPEIRHRNGKCNLSRGRMSDKVHFRYRGYYYDEETGVYYCFAGNDRNGDRCEAEILVVFTGSAGAYSRKSSDDVGGNFVGAKI